MSAHSPGPNNIGRRKFLNQVAKLAPIGATSALVSNALVTGVLAAPPPNQNKWLMCVNCYSLFYNGYPNKGRCPTGSPYRWRGRPLRRLHTHIDSPGPGQRDWRYCGKCHVLFFDGYPQKGVCGQAADTSRQAITSP